MAKSGAEIQQALRAFVAKWRSYAGSERGEAQTFLNELFACYGTDRFEAGAKFEDFSASAGFMDLHWAGVCIFEMKRPGTRVATGRYQIKRYWEESADDEHDVPAASWVVICSFQQFEIWEPGRYPAKPRIAFDLEELPDRYDALSFLIGPNVEPVFVEHHRELTKQAAERVASVYQSLVERSAAPVDEIQRFVMQAVWCLFAEDLGMLSGYPLQTTIGQLIQQGGSSAERIGYLFRVLNQKGSHNRKGVLVGTTYVNGELFADPAEVDLNVEELGLLREAAEFDWQRVDPTIFGSLMEGVLGRERRWELGAHYTHEADIMKIVTPTIVRPWQERIDAVTTPMQARDLLDELCTFKVLDPACGCGNFLYVAYRELRALEHLLTTRIADLARSTGLPEPAGPLPFVPLTNMQGIDIEPSAVMIARVTLWMGHRQMIERYGEAEPPLPLVALPTIQRADALAITWPETDCIIGNPPFLGAKHVRPSLPAGYADWLIHTFHVGVKDLCVYWFRRAQDHLSSGQRAGLVGTNSISQTGGRTASLEYLVNHGSVITDAISSQKWPGEAKVHVSIVNWVKRPQETVSATLNGAPVRAISTQLRLETGAFEPQALRGSRGRAFAGLVPQAKGFVISEDEALELLAQTDAIYMDVVRRFLTGDDLAKSPRQAPSRWIIDFASMPLERASRYPKALELVRRRVRPEREASENRAVERRWWLFGRRVPAMRAAVDKLPRVAVAASTSKWLPLAWMTTDVCPNNAVCIFAFSDDFSMGVLQSRPHVAWAWSRSSTFKGDLRYTTSSVLETFPWPHEVATTEQRRRVADVSRRLLARRSELCIEHDVGLTKLYNAMDEGAFTDLKALHRELDEAVAECYGWPKSISQDDKELVARLTELNRQIVEGERDYDPFAYLASTRSDA
ncbi:MAG: DNA methyltransferase [Nocardioidaceae bacterium]